MRGAEMCVGPGICFGCCQLSANFGSGRRRSVLTTLGTWYKNGRFPNPTTYGKLRYPDIRYIRGCSGIGEYLLDARRSMEKGPGRLEFLAEFCFVYLGASGSQAGCLQLLYKRPVPGRCFRCPGFTSSGPVLLPTRDLGLPIFGPYQFLRRVRGGCLAFVIIVRKGRRAVINRNLQRTSRRISIPPRDACTESWSQPEILPAHISHRSGLAPI